MQLNLFKQLIKKDFTQFPRLGTIAVRKDKPRSYKKSVKCFNEEFERRLQDFRVIKQDLDIFSKLFYVDYESVKLELQLELIPI